MLRARHILGAGILAAALMLAAGALCIDAWEHSDSQIDAFRSVPIQIDPEPTLADEHIRECCACGSAMSVERTEPIRQGHAAFVPTEFTPAWSDSTSPTGRDWAIRSIGMRPSSATLIYSCEQLSTPTAGFDAWQSPIWEETRRMLNQTPHFTK